MSQNARRSNAARVLVLSVQSLSARMLQIPFLTARRAGD